jgi:hypothetical protein
LALDSAKRQEPVLIKHRKAKDSTGNYRDQGRIRAVVISVRTRNPILGLHPRSEKADRLSFLSTPCER